MTQDKAAPCLDDEELRIADYLLQNPDFFNRHPQLIDALAIPDENGQTLSFVERRLARFRDKEQWLTTRLEHLLDNAKRNDRLFKTLRQVTLSLVELNSPEAFAQQATSLIAEGFGIPQVTLLLHQQTCVDQLPSEHIRLLDSQLLQNHAPNLVLPGNALCGQLKQPLLEGIFPGAEIQSAALAALYFHRPWGVLALGSDDADHFKSSMDTLFLTFLSELVCRQIHTLVTLNS